MNDSRLNDMSAGSSVSSSERDLEMNSCTVTCDNTVASAEVHTNKSSASLHDFDIDSLINKVKLSMLNPQNDDKKPTESERRISFNNTASSDTTAASDAAVAAVSDKKIWRHGMLDADQDLTKTVFIPKNVNAYDKCKKDCISYESSCGKLAREIEYFGKILEKVQSDMIETEYKADTSVVMGFREFLKQRLNNLTLKMNGFITDTLEGSKKPAPVKEEVSMKVSDTAVEYIFASDRKPTISESGTVEVNSNRIDKCADCNVNFIVSSTDTIANALGVHCETEVHRFAVGNTGPSATTAEKSTVVITEKTSAAEKTVVNKKTKKDTVTPKSLMINRLTPCLIDDGLLNCTVCGIACDAKDPKSHIDLKEHADNLAAYNHKLQYELMRKHPQAFSSFGLTDLHYVVNKIFVDPIQKFAYCGVCRKEVPAHQKNIEGHVDSPNHNNLLVAMLDVSPTLEDAAAEGGVDVLADFLAKGQPNNRMDSVGVPEESSLLRYVRKNHGFRHANGTYACLICNVKRLSTVKRINGHFSSKQHADTSIKMAACSVATPSQKAELLENFISANYDLEPVVYECLICPIVSEKSTSGLEEMLMHVTSEFHVLTKERYLRQPAAVQQPPHLSYAKIVPHRQGLSKMYCVACHLPLNNIAVAFEHVRNYPHNPDTLIEYIHSSGSGVYNCMACSVSFRGDNDLLEHVAMQEHLAAKTAKEAAKVSGQATANVNSISNASNMPKGFVVIDQNGCTQKTAKPKNSKTQENVKNKQGADNVKNKSAVVNKEKGAGNVKNVKFSKGNESGSKFEAEEMVLLSKNGVVLVENGWYICRHCKTGHPTRENVFGHIFSFKHAEAVSKK